MKSMLLGFQSMLAAVPEQFEDPMRRWDDLVFGLIVPILFGVLGGIFTIVGIMKASKIALANNEDSKHKAVNSMIWFLIGAVLCFVVAFITPILVRYLGNRQVFPNPQA